MEQVKEANRLKQKGSNDPNRLGARQSVPTYIRQQLLRAVPEPVYGAKADPTIWEDRRSDQNSLLSQVYKEMHLAFPDMAKKEVSRRLKESFRSYYRKKPSKKF